MLDDPERAIPDLVRFAAENRTDDPVDLEPQLIDLFRRLRTAEAIPFFASVIRRNPLDIADELVESLVELGAASVGPLLELLDEVEPKDAGDLPFALAALRVRDPRILEALTRRLSNDPQDAALCLDIYGDPAAIPALEGALAKIRPDDLRSRQGVQAVIDSLSKPLATDGETHAEFDIWGLYPQEDSPAWDALTDEERLAMLASDSAAVRAEVAASYQGSEPPDAVRARLLALAASDPEPAVRGACWEALGDASDEPEVRRALLGVLRDPNSSVEEKGGAAVALAQQADNPTVFGAIEALYAEPRSRAKALKAMARSFDRRFAGYPPKHLDNPDHDVKRQAIWGVGYLNLVSDAPRLKAFFDDDEYRTDALFAYALSCPGETSPGRVRALLAKVEEAAGGFRPDEEELVHIALDQRLMLHGKKAVFFPDDGEEEDEPAAAAPTKVGRNDLCPCGSGKKYKKCCGASA